MTGTSNTDKHQRAADAPLVVVVGAGFAGLATVKRLRRAGFRVTLIDRNLYSTFQPLLYQVATGGINPGDVSYAVGGFTRKYGARYTRGELVGIDAANQRVALADGRQLGYDYLIVATGVSASHFGIKGAAEYTYGLYTRADAVALRDRFMADIEALSMGPPDRELAITMVGGGATGVELAGTMAELRDVLLRETFPDVDPGRIHVRLGEMLPELLTPFDPKLRSYTRRQLEARGVDVRTDTAISEVTPDRVLLKNGQELHSDLTVWAAGVAAPPAAKGWGLPQGRAGRTSVARSPGWAGSPCISSTCLAAGTAYPPWSTWGGATSPGATARPSSWATGRRPGLAHGNWLPLRRAVPGHCGSASGNRRPGRPRRHRRGTESAPRRRTDRPPPARANRYPALAG
jgi:NADH:ubiquinone reductase (H+-translocating)